MPEKKTIERAKKAQREGKAATTQAGEFVREEIEHVREGKHGARSAKQAIAIGLSKARRAGVKVPAPKRGRASETTRRKAAQDSSKGASPGKRQVSAKRSGAAKGVLRREGQSAASKPALARQGRSAAAGRSQADRSRAAKKAAETRKRNRESRKDEGAQQQATSQEQAEPLGQTPPQEQGPPQGQGSLGDQAPPSQQAANP
jgi:hypothetical protein